MSLNEISKLKSLSISRELEKPSDECLIELPSGNLIDYNKLRVLPVDVVNHFFELMTRNAFGENVISEKHLQCVNCGANRKVNQTACDYCGTNYVFTHTVKF